MLSNIHGSMIFTIKILLFGGARGTETFAALNSQ